MINFFSDTQTLPTADMLRAISEAELGDDVFRQDPTVRRLEERASELTGMEAGLLVTSGTQGNVVSLIAHGGHGDEIYLDQDAHVYFYEAGGLCSLAGYTPRLIPTDGGLMSPEALEGAIRPHDDHFPRPRLLWLENTHNRNGGRILPQGRKEALLAVARRHGLKVHIDGARIFNAAVALNTPAAELCRGVDSVQFCLSKSLSCPIGSLVCGTQEFIDEARRVRKRLGGGMRQAGIIAACGLVALTPEWIARLAEDHVRARRLAELLLDVPGIHVDVAGVETNMVYFDIAGWGMTAAEAEAALAGRGVRASPSPPTRLRLVTHRHIADADVEEAAKIIRDFGRERVPGS